MLTRRYRDTPDRDPAFPPTPAAFETEDAGGKREGDPEKSVQNTDGKAPLTATSPEPSKAPAKVANRNAKK